MLISPARLADVIMALVVIEGIALATYRRRTGRGVRWPELASFLGAGLALVLAIRLVAMGAAAGAIELTLLAALVLHVWHLAARWQR